MKAIDKSEYDYYVDLIQKQADEYGKLLDDFKKARDKESRDAIQAIKDDGLKVSNERKKEAVNSIRDKKKLQSEFRKIDKDILESQIELIKIAVSVGKIGSEEGLKIIEQFQAKLVALGLKGADSGKKEKTKEELIKDAAETVKDLTYMLVDAMELEIQAEMSKEERKTAIQNNALKERLRNENLSAQQRANINKQIENNEIALQKTRDRLAEKQFKIQKAVAIGETLITTYKMATDAFATIKSLTFLPPPVALGLAKAAAATATAFGLSQVNSIRKTQFVPSGISGGGGSGSGGGGPQIQPPDFNIVGQSASNQVAQAVQGQFDKPVKAYVVSKDVSTAQEMDRNIVSTASL